MSPLIAASLGLLVFAAALALVRVLRRSSLADRLLGLDFFVTTVAAALVLVAVVSGSGVFVPVVVVVALLAFVATATVARFIEKRGA